MTLIKQANWIMPGEDYGDICPVFQKEISVAKPLVSARLYMSALGLYEVQIDGKRIGDFVFAPGWTSYQERLQYQEYNITDLLSAGASVLSVTLGKGWCVGKMTWDKTPNNWSDHAALIAAVELCYQDGCVETILSDPSWQTAKSSILMSEIYDGETYDARVTPSDFQDSVILEHTKDILLPQEGELVKEIEELAPIGLITTPKGEKVIDFGQNLTGYVRFSVCGKPGDTVELSHAEVFDHEGNFYTANMRGAENKITYICGGEEETFHPHFSFQGFRYVRVDNYPGEIDLNRFRAVVVHSEMKRTGQFECSNPLLNRLYENVIWGQKGNFLDVPTDCPQRDERLGWTGDAQVFIKAASYNFDVERFFRKWLRDLSVDQGADGSVPHVIPNLIKEGCSTGWGDASVICPWQVYLTYGNLTVLKEQFDSMQKWIEYIRARAKDGVLWQSDHHYADWLALDAAEGSYNGATEEFFVASAYYAYSTSLLIKAGKALGKDMSEYEALYQKIVLAFQAEYIKDGVLTNQTQTAHVLVLHFHLAVEKDVPKIAARLAELIAERGNHLSTGFLGTPYLLYALAQNGYPKLAVTLLLQEDFPSWLYPVTKGATTIWEHWDGLKPDGSFWSENMNSFNHYAYGAVADFLYSRLCGIGLDENAPGFSNIIFEPLFDGRLSYARASVITRNGTVKAGWEKQQDGSYRYDITVPCGSTADVILEGKTRHLASGEYTFQVG